MTPIVFVGPTLDADRVRGALSCDVRPPAARGDLLQAALAGPRAIGLIDGCFDGVPSVWHKEILWAISRGIRVYGAASLGALRAAELEAFGMIGVGSIFEQYRSLELEDDDEVAVAHASSEHGFRPLSDAMVNIRATLDRAADCGVISPGVRQSLASLAKALPYHERRYASIVEAAKSRGDVDALMLADFERWLPRGRAEQKRADALMLLERIREDPPETVRAVHFEFSHTDAWESLWLEVLARTATDSEAERGIEDWLVEELCLSGEFGRVYENAVLRSTACALAERNGVRLNPRAVEATIDDFRREHALSDPGDFETWLARQGLRKEQHVAFFTEEALVRATVNSHAPRVGAALVDYLRATGRYDQLRANAEARRALWRCRGIEGVGIADASIEESKIWAPFFASLGRPVPEDLERYARIEHVSVERLRSIALKSLLFQRMESERNK